MQLGNSALVIIKKYEGLRLSAYRDGGGVWTIGYGHTGRFARPHAKISINQANSLCQQDATEAAAVVAANCPRLTQPQLDALTSLVFNIGARAFGRSTLRKLHNEGRYAEAEQQFKRWSYDNKVQVPGLLTRRLEEARLYHAGSI